MLKHLQLLDWFLVIPIVLLLMASLGPMSSGNNFNDANIQGSGVDFLSVGYRVVDNNFLSSTTKSTEDKSYYLSLSGYNSHSQLAADNITHSVLVPASKRMFQAIKIFTWILITALFAFSIYFLFSISQVIVRIIRQKTFTEANHRSLLMIGISLIVISLLPFLIGLIMNFIFQNRIPGEINYSFWENFIRYRIVAIAGLIVLLVAKAFKQGSELQIDNALIF